MSLRWGLGAGASAYSYSIAGFSSLRVHASAVFELNLTFKQLPLELTSDLRPGYLLAFGALEGSNGGFEPLATGGAIRWYFQ